MNVYERHEQACKDHLHLYYSVRQIYGRQVKQRLFKKWHHRFVKQLCQGISKGRFVYLFSKNGIMAFTQKPKKKHAHRCPLEYAKCWAGKTL